MRWVRYKTQDNPVARIGVVAGGQIRGTDRARTLIDLLGEPFLLTQEGKAAMNRPSEVVDLAKVDLLAPIDPPPSIRDFLGFEAHFVNGLKKVGRTVDPLWYEEPPFYFTNPAAVRGPYDDIPVSPGSNMFDYELEIAAVVGKAGADIAPNEAGQHIAGFMIMCDWSARDLQFKEGVHGLGPAKGKDSATTLGPALVTVDELEDARSGRAYDLSMTATINGKRVAEGNLKDIYWSFEEMIAFGSRGTKMVPGDLIGSGTVGTGCLFETQDEPGGFGRFLQPGDQVVLEVERLGSISNRVVAGKAVQPLRPK